MTIYLAELKPALSSTGVEQVLRFSSSPDWTRADGQSWLPMLAVPFRRNTQVFDGAFQSQPQDYGQLEFAVSRGQSILPLVGMVWDGRPVKIWKGEIGQATSAMTVVFDGTSEAVSGKRSRVTVKLRGPNVSLPVLTSAYAGTGLAEGPSDLKNTPKPMLLGTAMNLEPQYVNRALGIFQYHAYGTGACSAVYDSGSQLGTSTGDYATYALLAAASVPAGRYATCNALGMARHGGEITGILTIDASGAVSGGLPGAVIKWLLRTHLALAAAKVKEDSLDWLDTQIPHAQDIYITEQILADELCTQLMLSLGGYIWFTEDGKFTVGLVRRGGTSASVIGSQNIVDTPTVRETSAPVWKRSMGYQRSWRVHSYAEVRTPREIVPRGTWSASPSPVYQYYELVEHGGASWIYVASAAGNTAVPGTDGAVWQQFQLTGANIVDSTTTPVDPQPGTLWRNSTNGQLRSYTGGIWILLSDVTSLNTAAAIAGQAATATSSDFSAVTGDSKPENNATSGQNRIYNGNAEIGTIAGWSQVEGSGGTIATSAAAASNGAFGFDITKASTAVTTAFGARAIAVVPGRTYMVRVTLKGSSATGSGLYIRMNEKTTAPANGHTVTSADRTGSTNLANNVAVPSVSTAYEFQYTVPAGVFFASPSILSWTNAPTSLKFDDFQMYEVVTENGIDVPSLSSITPTIGILRTATTGARTEIMDNVIKVYDASNVLRVKIGDLSL